MNEKINLSPFLVRETFDAGFRFFRARLDKGYSLTDCISMDLMQHMQLTEMLTNDGHFSQEGFSCLLREDVQWENCPGLPTRPSHIAFQDLAPEPPKGL